ncbi:3-isopropylmalate dehydratase small subunit [Amorphus orientalis]|uniref:3-isopropylmalate dehydratase n=1 Tax=Amorphus orientalis TaxID=649198 RepID=A0AAE4AU96_9HYPH|nr:3-isopropylmalate dehydratase small subunit [Amorphus orientalis]MDQ0316887.1 3-isopropylmalate/(R)-2-methylmalate dehydratase small subunit [Amorphus orientalis]
MTPLTRITSRAAFLPEENVDTDIIFPARFLLLMDRDGLGRYAFHDRRFDRDGNAIPGFVLDDPEFADAKILIAGDGFGCGSSREQAVWALAGHGIRCVIAPSFGEIFAGNCAKNGVLTITLPQAQIETLGALAQEKKSFEIDLERRTFHVEGDKVADLDLPETERQMLVNGWDETDLLLRDEGAAIDAFERAHRDAQPWLFEDPAR